MSEEDKDLELIEEDSNSEWEELLHSKSYEEQPPNLNNGIPYETMMELLLRPCRTKKELQNWIKIFLNIDLPDTIIDVGTNSCPLDMIWVVYETIVWYDNIDPKDRCIRSVFYCSRGSFKSLGACVIELLTLLHTDRNVVHQALILQQAKNAYNLYLRKFFELPYIKDRVVSSILEKSIVKNRFDKEVVVYVIPTTMNSTSSLRAQLLVRDEIDKLKGEQHQAYINSEGMLTATNDKKFPIVFDISTRDSSHGQIQNIIDNADKTGTKVFHWNRIDITTRCSDERSGSTPIEIYVKNDSLTSISRDQFQSLDRGEKNNYTKHWGLEGCLKNCNIFSSCLGYLKNQESKCKWLKSVEETENAIMSAPSEEMVISQLLCRKPPSTGLVYSDFEVSRNVKTASEMYEIFTGEKPSDSNMTVEEFIQILIHYNIPLYMGADAGFHNPAASLIAIDKNENIYILREYAPNNIDSPDFAQDLYDLWGKYPIKKIFADPESPDLASALRKKNFVVSKRVDKKVQLGISTVKGFIKVPSTQKTKLFVHTDCSKMRVEFTKYAYKLRSDGKYDDVPEKEFDHLLDSVRYCIHTIFCKMRSNLGYEVYGNSTPRSVGEYLGKEISPQNVAEKAGFKLTDNRCILENKEEKRKKKTTAFDINDY